MNAPVDLHTRLRSAGKSLHRAVEPIPVDEPPSVPSGGRLPRRTLLAAAAVVLVVAAVVGAAVALRADREDRVSNDPDAVPFLIFDSPPKGLPISGGVTLPLEVEGEPGTNLSLTLYDVDGKDLAVMTSEDRATDDPAEPEDPEHPVTVRGKQGAFEDTGILGRSVSWTEAEGVEVAVYSRTLTQEQLVTTASAATGEPTALEPGPLAAAGATPRKVGAVGGLTTAGMALPNRAVGHVVGYQGPEGADVAAVATITATPDEVAVLRWFAGATTMRKVRGHDGSIGSQTSVNQVSVGDGDTTEAQETTSWTVTWEESPGIYALVMMTNVTEEELLALVDDIRPATRVERSQIAAATLTDDEHSGTASEESEVSESALVEVPEGARPIFSGEFDAGGTWLLYLDHDQLCADLNLGATSGGSCGAIPDAPHATAIHAEGVTFVYGVAPEGTIYTAPDGMVAPTLVDGKLSPLFFGVPIEPGRPVPSEIKFYGGAGDVIARLPVRT